MIAGGATAEGTRLLFEQYKTVCHHPLGHTGLWASAAGFGCYRINRETAAHHEALRTALRGGINLIDTSANYADGGSELLIGEVLREVIESGARRRDQIVVVSKAGYLQGRNYALSRERQEQGRAFEDLVAFGDDMAHCVHPDFLEDQLTRSLDRLGLERLDFFLLHNPEYYLSWARKQQTPLEQARREYYRRIRKACLYLEKEVARGRIQWYGVSSNTFGGGSDDPEFTSLSDLIAGVTAFDGGHHLAAVQLPLNLLEPGAVLERNQPDGENVVSLARRHGLAVLINRPLNAIVGKRLTRLADIVVEKTYTDDAITTAITRFKRSEKRFVHHLLPRLAVPAVFAQRLADQIGVGDQLKHYWRNFGGYERWRDVRDGFFLPRVQSVLTYLKQHEKEVEDLRQWIRSHERHLNDVLAAVTFLYSGEAAAKANALRRAVTDCDRDWGQAASLSQMALRAVRSTQGVSCVLVGMRAVGYVADVMQELRRPVRQQDRRAGWEKLSARTGAARRS